MLPITSRISHTSIFLKHRSSLERKRINLRTWNNQSCQFSRTLATLLRSLSSSTRKYNSATLNRIRRVSRDKTTKKKENVLEKSLILPHTHKREWNGSTQGRGKRYRGRGREHPRERESPKKLRTQRAPVRVALFIVYARARDSVSRFSPTTTPRIYIHHTASFSVAHMRSIPPTSAARARESGLRHRSRAWAKRAF